MAVHALVRASVVPQDTSPPSCSPAGGVPEETGERRNHMRRSVTTLAILSCLLLVLPAYAHAQATGTISGVVKDDTGAVLPGATLEARSRDTAQVRRTTTGGHGFSTIPLLPPGEYVVRTRFTGFRDDERSVRVTVAETARVDIFLHLPSHQDYVTVIEQAPLVETANGTLGIVVDHQKVVD